MKLFKILFAVMTVLLLSYTTFYKYSADLFVDNDNIKIYRIVQDGKLPWFTGVNPPDYFSQKQRPFAGFAWNIAGILGGGNIVNYYYFHFTYLLLSAVIISLISYLLYPKSVYLSFLAGLFKLIWSSDHQVYSNVCIQIAFSEITALAAIFFFSVALTAREKNYKFYLSFVLSLAMQVISSGVYEMVWHLHFIYPVMILCFNYKLILDSIRNRWVTVVWLFLLFSYVAVYFISNSAFIKSAGNSPNLEKVNLLFGIQVSKRLYEVMLYWIDGFNGSSFITFKYLLKNMLDLNNYREIETVFLLSMLLVLASLILIKMDLPAIEWKYLILGFIFSVLLIFSGVILPSFSYGIGYGNRLIHFSSYGAILFLVFFILMLRRFGNVYRFIIILLSFAVVFSSSLTLKSAAQGFSRVHSRHFAYWRSLLTEIPSLKKNSVLILENHPFSGTYEFSDTEYLRNFLHKKCIYYFNTPFNEIVDEGKSIKIYGTMRNPMEQCENTDPETESLFYENIGLFWSSNWDKRFSVISKDRVIHLKWINEEMKIEIDPSRSNMSLIESNNLDNYAQNLLNLKIYQERLAKGERMIDYYTPTFSDERPLKKEYNKIFSKDALLGYFSGLNPRELRAIISKDQLKVIRLPQGKMVLQNPSNSKTSLIFFVRAEAEGTVKIVSDAKNVYESRFQGNEAKMIQLSVPKGKSEYQISYAKGNASNAALELSEFTFIQSKN